MQKYSFHLKECVLELSFIFRKAPLLEKKYTLFLWSTHAKHNTQLHSNIITYITIHKNFHYVYVQLQYLYVNGFAVFVVVWYYKSFNNEM